MLNLVLCLILLQQTQISNVNNSVVFGVSEWLNHSKEPLKSTLLCHVNVSSVGQKINTGCPKNLNHDCIPYNFWFPHFYRISASFWVIDEKRFNCTYLICTQSKTSNSKIVVIFSFFLLVISELFTIIRNQVKNQSNFKRSYLGCFWSFRMVKPSKKTPVNCSLPL